MSRDTHPTIQAVITRIAALVRLSKICAAFIVRPCLGIENLRVVTMQGSSFRVVT